MELSEIFEDLSIGGKFIKFYEQLQYELENYPEKRIAEMRVTATLYAGGVSRLVSPTLALLINRITNDEPLTVCPTCTKRIGLGEVAEHKS